MPTLTEDYDVPGGVDPANVRTTVELWGAGAPTAAREIATGKTIYGPFRTTGNPWSIANMVGNAGLDTPTGTVYRVESTWPGLGEPLVEFITLPTTGGPYKVRDILTDPPGALTPSGLAAHAADITQHGGSRRIALANVGTNFMTSSTSFVDVTGASITFVVPSVPWQLFCQYPTTIGLANEQASVKLVTGTGALILEDTVRATAAGQVQTSFLRVAVPATTYNPTAGTTQTVKVQAKTSNASSQVTFFVDFAGVPLNVFQLEAVTQAT